MTTEELIIALRQRLTHGHQVDDLLAQLSQTVVGLQGRLASSDATARKEAEDLQEEIAKLAELGENRMNGLQTEMAAIARKGSLDRLYGLSHH